jgi:dihydrolipoamide dehydrogenase
VDAVVLTTPRAGNTGPLDLAQTKAELDDDGFVRVNERLGTSDPRILAVGDVTGPPHFADRALVQGRVAGEIVAGRPSIYDPQAVPFVMFSEPQVAWCGLTETAARAEGITAKTARIPWGMSGRAVGMGRAEGLTKLIYDADSQLVLGVGLCGTNAAELIGEAALAVEMGCELTDLAETMHPHPTMAELLADAARRAVTEEER